MSVELSKQKLDLDEAARFLHQRIIKMQEDERILLRAIEEIDKGENILETNSILANAAKEIMYNLIYK